MKQVNIKKILLGVLLSDGSLDKNHKRFEVFNKNKEFVEVLSKVLEEVPGIRFSTKEVFDKRYNRVTGYRLWSTKHPVLTKIYDKVYGIGRKELNRWSVSRLNEEALAWVWMCDGYLEHTKNRKIDRVQNIGWFCLESFPKEELELLQEHLEKSFGISSSLVKKPWGFGYRLRIGGESLQKFISIVYPYMLDCFKYKTVLFYRNRNEQRLDLPNAEQFLVEYTGIEDIVRHPTKAGTT
jgi:hypothetical protein